MLLQQSKALKISNFFVCSDFSSSNFTLKYLFILLPWCDEAKDGEGTVIFAKNGKIHLKPRTDK